MGQKGCGELQNAENATVFDLLIIGGGATGCGIALDAASRGLKVMLVERQDLAEGTSSRSTKLVHGGVRYLEAAVKRFDKAQYHLVKEALFERGLFLANAPHLAYARAMVTPLYRWYEAPYVYAGLLLYDLLAGKKGLGRSVLISRHEALQRFPMLKSEGLKAGVIYYDGQFNDARMAVSLALTAQKQGARIATHTELIGFVKENGYLRGAHLRNTITGEQFSIKARGIINATGPFADRLRQMDDASAEPLLKTASGIHIVLPKRFVAPETGLLIPKTDDGRVLFILPWQGHALVGTTDTPSAIVDHPQAQEEEIAYVLRHINRYFNLNVSRADVTAAWSGLRPLVQAPKSMNTAELVREHLILASDSGLLSVLGGKWTSYRKMAEETIDQALKLFQLSATQACPTEHLTLIGSEQFNAHGQQALINDYALDEDIAQHLHSAFGDQASCVADLAQTGLGARLHAKHPYIEAEVVYALRHEFAERLSDVLTRRIPLAMLDNAAAKAVLPRVLELARQECAWSDARCTEEMALCMERLNTAI